MNGNVTDLIRGKISALISKFTDLVRLGCIGVYSSANSRAVGDRQAVWTTYFESIDATIGSQNGAYDVSPSVLMLL